MLRIFLVMLTLCLMAPAAGLAQGYAPQSRALVVLRFNQPRVVYEPSLYDAIAKAAAAKPEVMFDVVSFAPSTGDPRMDKAWEGTAGHNTQSVVASMQRMGVPLSRIRVYGQHLSGLTYDEVHIFVK